MKTNNIVRLAIAAACIAIPGAASAQIKLTPLEIQAIISTTNSFEGRLDGTLAGEAVQLRVLGPRKFTYKYMKSGKSFTFDGDIDRDGGRRDGTPTLNYKQPDGREVRFQWANPKTIRFEYWEPGRRAGAQRNNPAMAKATLVPVAAPVTAPAPVISAERQKQRQAAAQLLAPGKYRWAPGGATLTVNTDGSFAEDYGSGVERGFVIRNGNEVCFDLVYGTCFTVTRDARTGVHALMLSAKMMQVTDTNPNAGRRSTLTPIK